MTSLRNLSILAAAAAFSLNLAACTKRNTELETDYATKKASAETLVNQIDSSMATMKADHDQWKAALAADAAKPGADTSKINSLRSDIAKHETDGANINALVDSTKMYMNATPDQGDAFKNADDRLGTNFNDLSDKWKSYQDTHASINQRVQQLAVTTAGAAITDSAKAKTEIKKATPPAKKAMKAEAPKPAMHEHPGVTRNSAH
jgi:chromosome segregation ATPase